MNISDFSLNFVTYAYPLLAGLHLMHAFIRAYRYWQIQRDLWLKWQVISSLGSAIMFALFSTFISKAPLFSRDFISPWARLSTGIILVGLGVAVIGQLHDLVVITKMREQNKGEAS